MMRLVSLLLGAVLVAGTTWASAEAPKPAVAASATAYSTRTTQLSVLLADPAAKAVLEKRLPALVNNPDMADRASGMTLREIADAVKAYSPDLLSEKVLGELDADLAKVPVKP
jgi:para-nitrobenzyl esterase